MKFTMEGGAVIRAHLDREDERLAVIRFSVEDSGIGIPINRQAAIFLPFTQVDGSEHPQVRRHRFQDWRFASNWSN